MKIVEGEYQGKPTFLITNDNETKVLWKIETTDNKPIWTNRIAWGWHTLDRNEAEKVLQELSESK